MPSLEELLAMNAAPDEPTAPSVHASPPPAPRPAQAPAPPPLEQLLALNEAPDESPPSVEVPSPAPSPSESPQGVRVVAPDGQVTEIHPDDVDPAVRLRGYRVLTPEVEQELSLQRTHGTTGGQVVAGIQGFARGVTLGASDYLARVASGVAGAMGAPDVPRAAGPGIDAPLLEGPGIYDEEAANQAAQDIQAYREANPITATTTELVGAIAPAVASGGTGAVGTLARLTPAGRLASLGTRLGESLAARATKAGLGAVGRIGALGVAAAAEGAVDNAIRTVADDLTRGDVDITAERMVNAAWEGAKWGGLLGAGFASVAEGAGAIARARAARAERLANAIDEVPPSQVDNAAEQARPSAEVQAELDAAQERLAQADAAGEPTAIQDAEELVERLTNERDAAVAKEAGLRTEHDIDLSIRVEEPAEAQGLWQSIRDKFRKVKDAKELDQRFQDEVDRLTTSITNRLDDIQRAKQNDIDPRISRNNKPKAIKAALEREGVVWTLDQAERVLRENEETLRAIDELRREYPLGDEVARRKLGPLKSAKEAIEGVQKHLIELKDTAGKNVDYREATISPGAKILRGDLDAIAAIFWAEDNLKSYLGQIAKKKGETVTQAEATIQRMYMRKRASLQDPKLYGRPLAEMQTVTNAIESRAIPAGRVFHNLFGQAKGELWEHAGQHGFEELMDFDPHKIKAMLKTLAEADSYKDEAAFIRGLQRTVELAEAKSKYYPVSDEIVAKIAEARKTVDAIIDDVRTIKVLKAQRDKALRLAKDHEGIDRIMMAMDVVGAFVPGVHLVGKAIGTATEAVRLATSVEKLGEGAVKTERAIDKAVNAASKNFFRGPVEAVRQAVKKGTFPGTGITANQLRRAIEDAQALQDPDSEQSQNVSAQLEDVARESPELAQALEARIRAKAEYILEKNGPTLDTSDPFNPKPAVQDPVTQASVARYVEAALHPYRALERIGTGAHSREDLETLQALYPRIYETFVQRVVDKARQAKVPPTPTQRQRLHWSTGVPMSREQAPAYVAYIQAVAARAASQAPEDGSNNLRPMVTRAKAAPVEGLADQVMARSDAIMTREA